MSLDNVAQTESAYKVHFLTGFRDFQGLGPRHWRKVSLDCTGTAVFVRMFHLHLGAGLYLGRSQFCPIPTMIPGSFYIQGYSTNSLFFSIFSRARTLAKACVSDNLSP